MINSCNLFCLIAQDCRARATDDQRYEIVNVCGLNDTSNLCCIALHQVPETLAFYPRDAMLARVIAIAMCPSVRPSVTRRYCVKTKKASVMIS